MAKPIQGLTAAAAAAGFTGGGWLPVGSIRYFVGQRHVGTPALVLAREYWRRAAAYPRPVQRAVVRAALREHAANRALYRAVTRGF